VLSEIRAVPIKGILAKRPPGVCHMKTPRSEKEGHDILVSWEPIKSKTRERESNKLITSCPYATLEKVQIRYKN
jgi:hypothetical protein